MLWSTALHAKARRFLLSPALWWSCFPSSCFPALLSFFSLPQLLPWAEQYRFRAPQTVFLWQDIEPGVNFNLFGAGAVASLMQGREAS